MSWPSGGTGSPLQHDPGRRFTRGANSHMLNTYFPDIRQPIPYEGKDSKNPFAFKYYNRSEKVGSRTMGEHLRFSVAYWHTFMGDGSDMFGGASFTRGWRLPRDPMDRARA